MWAVAAAALTSWVLVFPVYLATSATTTLLFFILPLMFSNFYLATTLANTQSLVGLRMRGVASAIVLFIINIIGLGLGPQFAGIFSDLLAPRFGDESMRYTLLGISAIGGPWTALHYYFAGKTLEKDLRRATE